MNKVIKQINRPIRFAKSYEQFMKFQVACKTGERVIYHGMDYVAMDRKSYEELLKRSDKLLSEQREELVKKIEGLKNDWETRPPEAGKENSKNGWEMYQCGYFDALDSLIYFIQGDTKEKVQGDL